ncbi:DUF3549 family protein [Microbulbifer yueqingensis]|uniref:DUF3549 domain-containing protein n=1 Tax=Microbulbifer yueqingensis TaxID=658219 RepID=A0A1G8X194_9GAMM|nr:DUF3549 family protein [Microbulbifer yueqingensis]SDJ84418.1 Protein of unknown function [Microbulbifer yueqingensis]
MTDSSTPGTLTGLITEARFKSRWFDLGRRVRPVSASDVEAFESGSAAWPYPYLREAWTGLLLWPEEGGEPAVWFLRQPLDEQGKLRLAARDQFLALLNQKLSGGDGRDAGEQLGRALEESDLVYSPAPERQATFHAKAARLLHRPASNHLAAVLEYFRAPHSASWQELGLQGIADLAARWEEYDALLRGAIDKLATPVLVSLCQSLESESIDHRLAQAVIHRAERELANPAPETAIIAAAVRAISFSPARGMRQDFLQQVLGNDRSCAGEVLAAIGSRCPEDLQEHGLAANWLARLAACGQQQTFNLLLADLMFLPDVRAALLDALRSPDRPESLAQAFGTFLHGPGPTH